MSEDPLFVQLGYRAKKSAERWREPVEIVSIESSTGTVRFGNDSRLQRDYEVIVTEGTYDRMKAGYMCAQCYEPFEQPFPEQCGVCNFRVRDLQPKQLNDTYLGETWVGSTQTLDDELAELAEKNERAKRAAQVGSSQIVLPPNVNLN